MRKAFLVVLGLAIVASALVAPVASAANEKLKLREFYPGGTANNSYVVIQAYAAGQNHIAGHTLRWVSNFPTGGSADKTFTFPSDVINEANQATVLIADSGYSGTPTPDFTVPNLSLFPGAGLLCIDYHGIEVPPYAVATDCVAWGGSGSSEPPYYDEGTGFGFPAFQLGGIAPGKAGIRMIGLSCPTLLEGRDDQNEGNSDWYETAPNPRNNASPIVEKPCNPPHTGINSATVKEGETTTSTSVRIAFAASPFPETTYECKLDGGSFQPCVSPVEYTGLNGDETPTGTPHTFEVRAANVNGLEQTPASRSWIVNTTLSLLAAPAEPPSSATTAAFAGAGTPGAAGSAVAAPASAASQGMAARRRAKSKKKQTPKKRRTRRSR